MTDAELAAFIRRVKLVLDPRYYSEDQGKLELATQRLEARDEEAAEALSLTVSPLPSPGEAAAAAVCHDEQLEIWADEFAEHLLASGHAPEFTDYEDKLAFFASIKAGIKGVVESAFTHPELEKAVSPLPDEITGLIQELDTSAQQVSNEDDWRSDSLFGRAAAALARLARGEELLKETLSKSYGQAAEFARARDEKSALIRELEAEHAAERDGAEMWKEAALGKELPMAFKAKVSKMLDILDQGGLPEEYQVARMEVAALVGWTPAPFPCRPHLG